MTALKFIMTIINICDGDKNPNLRHKYTLDDMIIAQKFAEIGDKNLANVTFFDLNTYNQIKSKHK
jgi:hypothetical protein